MICPSLALTLLLNLARAVDHLLLTFATALAVFATDFAFAAASLMASLAQNTWQLVGALTLLSALSAVLHPVGIPMLRRHGSRPGNAIGWNGMSGNVGIAVAATLAGLPISAAGGHAAFVVPVVVTLGLGVVFARKAPAENEPPARHQKKAAVSLPASLSPAGCTRAAAAGLTFIVQPMP